MSIDLKFVELTADVLEFFFIKYLKLPTVYAIKKRPFPDTFAGSTYSTDVMLELVQDTLFLDQEIATITTMFAKYQCWSGRRWVGKHAIVILKPPNRHNPRPT